MNAIETPRTTVFFTVGVPPRIVPAE